jgi:hypothetical protein
MVRYWILLAATVSAATVDYSRDVHPILAAKCFACHSGDKRSGNLSLANYSEIMRGGRTGKVVSPGVASESTLIQRVLGDGAPLMPPVGQKLEPNEVTLLREWIDQGARPRPGAPPARPNWIPHMALTKPAGAASVDDFLSAYWRKNKVAPPGVISDSAFARRVYLDTWGLLPAPEQLAAFTGSRAAGKRRALIRDLLANNRNYTEHWISYWKDLLRDDEGVNYHGGRKSISTWLYGAIEQNLPYDEFARQLLNPVQKSDPDGFLQGVNWRGDVNSSQTPVMQAAQNSAQIFLGVNLKCNSCHDSFVSRWKLKDAYGLASFFSEDKLELVRCDVKLGEFMEPKFVYPELGAIPPGLPMAEKRAAAARLFTSRENGRFARTVTNRIWKRLIGRGLVEPVDDMDAEPWSPELLDFLAADFVEHGYDLKHLIEAILTSRAHQLPAAASSEPYVFQGPAPRRLTAEQFIDAISSITGEWRARDTGQLQAELVREWRLPSSRLTRALGRPIRDQVFTERNETATTMQMLELVNGDAYTRYLRRAAKKMLGELEAPPENLFDSGRVGNNRVKVDIDVTGLKQLRLLAVDVDSYSPDRVLPAWAHARWIAAQGEVVVDGSADAVRFKDQSFEDGLRVKLPSEQVFDIAGKGYTRFQATVGVEESCLASDINPRVRFFAFREKPDMERLLRAKAETPVPPPPGTFTTASLIARLYQHALGRAATPAEQAVARDLLGAKPGVDGLADLIWALTALPEFQLLR